MITIEEGIKQEIAERVASSTTPGYSTALHGQWFVVDGEAVVHRASNAPWNPWPDGSEAIGVSDLVWFFGGAELEGADFSPFGEWEIAVEFALGYVPDAYDPSACRRSA
jgi:hypothetical protein